MNISSLKVYTDFSKTMHIFYSTVNYFHYLHAEKHLSKPTQTFFVFSCLWICVQDWEGRGREGEGERGKNVMKQLKAIK